MKDVVGRKTLKAQGSFRGKVCPVKYLKSLYSVKSLNMPNRWHKGNREKSQAKKFGFQTGNGDPP